eukprot:g5463.t1
MGKTCDAGDTRLQRAEGNGSTSASVSTQGAAMTVAVRAAEGGVADEAGLEACAISMRSLAGCKLAEVLSDAIDGHPIRYFRSDELAPADAAGVVGAVDAVHAVKGSAAAAGESGHALSAGKFADGLVRMNLRGVPVAVRHYRVQLAALVASEDARDGDAPSRHRDHQEWRRELQTVRAACGIGSSRAKVSHSADASSGVDESVACAKHTAKVVSTRIERGHSSGLTEQQQRRLFAGRSAAAAAPYCPPEAFLPRDAIAPDARNRMPRAARIRFPLAIDSYAFGIVLWELFTGLRPFAGVVPDAVALARAQAHAEASAIAETRVQVPRAGLGLPAFVYAGARPNRDLLLGAHAGAAAIFKPLALMLDDCWRVEKGKNVTQTRPSFIALSSGVKDGDKDKSISQRLAAFERHALGCEHVDKSVAGHGYDEFARHFRAFTPHTKGVTPRRDKGTQGNMPPFLTDDIGHKAANVQRLPAEPWQGPAIFYILYHGFIADEEEEEEEEEVNEEEEEEVEEEREGGEEEEEEEEEDSEEEEEERAQHASRMHEIGMAW